MYRFGTTMMALAAGFLATVPVGAVVIDDYGGGTPEDFYSTVTTLVETGGTILGDERETVISPSSVTTWGVSNGLATFAEESSPNGVVYMHYDGVGDESAAGGLKVDLTVGGAHDRFLLDIHDFGATIPNNVVVSVYGEDPADRISGSIAFSAAGIAEILFADLTSVSGNGADITSAVAVRTTFTNIQNSFGISLDGFCTGVAGGNCSIDNPGTPDIPEPSTMVLLGSALAGLGWWRRKR